MPTLEELRAQFRRVDEDGGDDEDSSSHSLARPRYKLNKARDDGMLFFGSFQRKTLRQIANIDPTYLHWMLRQEFPDELKDVVRVVLRRVTPARSKLATEEGSTDDED
jgi:hypothetical protein